MRDAKMDAAMLEHSLRRQRDTMRALLECGYLRHPMGRWAWRLAQARFLGHQLDRITAAHAERWAARIVQPRP